MKLISRFFPVIIAGIAALLMAGCNGGNKTAVTAPAKSLDEADLSVLTPQNHPRLFINGRTFKDIRKSLKKNPLLANLHGQMMQQAQDFDLAEAPLVYKKDQSNKRILHVSRAAMTRIASAAYAYRMTGDKRYLEHAEKDLNDVCDFANWNPSHYLDTGEMSLAVSIGYDWLYDVLSPETKKKIEEKLVEYAFNTSEGQAFYNRTNNWNQVCNAGLISAALTIWETNPEFYKAQVAKSIESNKGALKAGYSPDGAYPEGSTYWEYGTEFQCIMVSALESTLGSDFGICSAEGFDKTADYQMHSVSNTLERFNYSDCGSGFRANPALWFFAVRFNRPDVLYLEQAALERKAYVDNRTLFLALTCAAKADFSAIPVPDKNMYTGAGITPVAMMRTGWDEKDLYLGVKGGKSSNPHGHMDIGEFVFDAYGYRWAVDYGQPAYSTIESFFIKELGSSPLFNGRQDSPRWDLFSYNNKQHNTITINDSKFDVSAFCPITATSDDPMRMSATVDLTASYFGAVESVVRTAAIVDKAYLEVKDNLKGGSKPARVRWTLVTRGEPEFTDDGIILSQGGIKMKLHADGAAVTYKSWPTDEESMGLDGKDFVQLVSGSWIVGFEFDLQKNAEVNLVTTLKKI